MLSGRAFRSMVILFVIFSLVVLHVMNISIRETLMERSKIRGWLSEIQAKEFEIEIEMLRYIEGLDGRGFETAIRELLDAINNLKANRHFVTHHEKVLEIIKQYENRIFKKINLIEEVRYMVINVKIQTKELVDLLSSSLRLSDLDPDMLYKMIVSVIGVFSAGSVPSKEDIKSLKGLSDSIKRIYNSKPPAEVLTFVKKLEDIIMQLENIQYKMQRIVSLDTLSLLNSALDEFMKETKMEYRKTNIITHVATILLFIGVIFVFAMFVMVEKQNISILRLHRTLERMSVTDGLTGILNRFAFERDVKHFESPVLFLIDIDNFSEINDLYGMRIGDEILISVAHDLKKLFASYRSAKVYRIGADDFAILIDKQVDALNEPYEVVAKDIIDFVENKTFKTSAGEIHITVVVSVSDQRPLFENADLTMHYVKRSHHLKYAVYSEELDYTAQVEKNIKTVGLIKKALAEDRVVPFYQPIVCNKTKEIVKYEALVRILDEDGNVISPGEFLYVAKRSRLYRDITVRMLEKSYEVIKAYNVSISINLSSKDIEDGYIRGYIKDFLSESADYAHLVTFEIVESENVEKYDIVLDFTKLVKSFGAKIALDDFGSGYSNFMYVLKFDPDYIKIDGSLIEGLLTDRYAQLVVSSIVKLAKEAGIKTVAEFVSSEEIYQKVCEMGIDYSQGFLFGRPGPTIRI